MHILTCQCTISFVRMLKLCLYAGLLDHIKVQVYGQNMPIKAVANISVRDAQTIVVTAFDPSVRIWLSMH